MALRIRPLSHEERKRGCKAVVEKLDNKMVELRDAVPHDRRKQDHLRQKRSNDRQYLFDAAFGSDSSQSEVYDVTTRPLVDSVLDVRIIHYVYCLFTKRVDDH